MNAEACPVAVGTVVRVRISPHRFVSAEFVEECDEQALVRFAAKNLSLVAWDEIAEAREQDVLEFEFARRDWQEMTQ